MLQRMQWYWYCLLCGCYCWVKFWRGSLIWWSFNQSASLKQCLRLKPCFPKCCAASIQMLKCGVAHVVPSFHLSKAAGQIEAAQFSVLIQDTEIDQLYFPSWTWPPLGSLWQCLVWKSAWIWRGTMHRVLMMNYILLFTEMKWKTLCRNKQRTESQQFPEIKLTDNTVLQKYKQINRIR